MAQETQAPHGYYPCCEAATPLKFSRADFWYITKYVIREIKTDNVSIIAAGVAFFTMLAIFPLITALLSIYGYFADPSSVQEHLYSVSGLIPADAWVLLNDQVNIVTSTPNSKLGLRIICSLALALWAAGAGIRALMQALNIAYGESEKRHPIKFYALAILFTLGMTLLIWLGLGVIIGIPAFLSLLKLDGLTALATRYLPWGLLLGIFSVAITVLYRYGPSRRPAKLRWLIPGTLFATIGWIAISVLFSRFVAAFGNYNATYGSLSAVVLLLIWFWLTAFIVLVGAEINGEMERHTRVDTTRGPDRPPGQRGAAMADWTDIGHL